MGFIDRPFADMAVVCVHSRLDRRPDFGPGLPIPDSFRSCRSSRLQRFPPQRVDPRTHPSTACRFVAPCSRPWGSPRFRLPGPPFGFPRPEGRGPEGPMESSPVAKTLRSFSLPGSRRPNRHRAFSFRSRLRSPVGVPPRRSSCVRFRVATVRYALSRPRGFVPPRSPLRWRSVSAAYRSMLPWALISTRSDAAARFRAVQTSWTFRRASELAWRPRTRTSWGRQSVSALSGSSRPKPDRVPEGSERNRSRVAPAHPEGSASAASVATPKGSKDADGSTPKGRSTPSAPWHPKALGLRRIASDPRRDRVAIQRTPRRVAPVVRARAPQPCAVTRAPLRNPLAADFRRPKAWSSARHSRPRPEGRCVEPFPWTPEGITAEGRVVRPPEGDPLTAHGSVHSSKLERRSRARQTSSSSNRFRPESRAGSFRAAPKRVPEPLRGVTRLGDEGERVDVSRQRTFPKTRSSR